MRAPSLPLQVPRRGLIRNTAPHRVGPEAVVDGQNMLLRLDGLYGCRPGYVGYGAQGALAEPPRGGIFFRDVARAPRIVVGGATGWSAYDSATDAWVDITPAGDPLTGDLYTPIRFTTYAQSGVVWAVGANDEDPLKRWNPATAEYVEITGAPSFRDITVLANRLVGIAPYVSGTRYPSRVQWSSAADITTYPALATNDLDLAGEELIAISPLSRYSAAMYRAESIWLLHAQDGGDATAFAPERVSSGNDGPVSPAAVVRAGRAHYFLAKDNKIYRFDGVEPVVISEPISGLLDEIISPAGWSKMHGVFYARRREIWWWLVRSGESEPQSAFVFNVDAQRWEIEQRFSVGVTTSIRAEDQRAGSWDADNNTWDSDDTTWDAETGEPYLVLLLGFDTNIVAAFGDAPADAGAAIAATWKLPLIYAGEQAQVLLDEIESYFAQATTADVTSVTVNVYSLQHPLASPVLQYTGSIDLTSLIRLTNNPGDSTEWDSTNYTPGIQIEYAAQVLNHRAFQWGGGTLSVYQQEDG